MRTTVLTVLVAALVLSTGAHADWNLEDPFKWLQQPDLGTTGIDVSASGGFLLADDFECKETGLITEVHLWGSWYQDLLPFGEDPNAAVFTLSIHKDIPADQSPTDYSMPGELLWMRRFQPGEFTARIWQQDLREGWLSPPDNYDPNGDTICWQYNFFIDAAEAFLQTGTDVNPVVYWLDVKAEPIDDASRWGWKTSLSHWNDDAVWGQGEEPYSGPWGELRYPSQHPFQGESIDLAFVISGQEPPPGLDFGDAPDFYRTLLASDGARHNITANLLLGSLVDPELDGQASLDALGDDNSGVDDEDGVDFKTLIVPQSAATVEVTVVGTGYLNGWIDFGSDGTWSEAGDHIIVDQNLVAGTHSFTFLVPASAPLGSTTYARFRYSSAAGLGFAGIAPDGEVEDYRVFIEPSTAGYKWEQEPDLSTEGMDVDARFILADDFLCLEAGRITTIEIWGSWYQDFLPFNEDPRGVQFTLSFHSDRPATGPDYSRPDQPLWWRVFPPGSYQAQIYASDLQEGWLQPPDTYQFPGDTICWLYKFDVPLPEAFEQTPGRVFWLDVKAEPVDPEAFFGWKTSFEHWNDDAVWGQGEEPYLGPWFELFSPVTGESLDLAFRLINTPVPDLDFGDAPDFPGAPGYSTLLSQNGARHTIVSGVHLGSSVDAEPDGQPDANALGDDNDGNDDENGVVFKNILRPNDVGLIDVTASTSGYLDVWVDHDGDGQWSAADQVLSNVAVTAGVNALSFPLPSGATVGPTFARFRFYTPSIGPLSFDGLAPDGEVEDYEVVIEEELVLKWYQSPDLSDQGLDVHTTVERLTADDFLCTDPNPLTDIYVWGSWVNDYLPYGQDPWAVTFTLSIHEDIPASESPTGYSMPGNLLWLWTFQPADFGVYEYANQLVEGWLEPPSFFQYPGDTVCWLYHFHVDPPDAFLQRGTPGEPVVYWLDVQAQPGDAAALWGWKTTRDHWNDDAVWGQGQEPYTGPWFELRYPPLHPLVDQSIDLAFALYSNYPVPVPPEAPYRSHLEQNVPNPFNPKTEIEYVLEREGPVTLEIFDVRGRVVRHLVDEIQVAGPQKEVWNGENDAGESVASGVYFYRLRAAGIDQALKMILLR